MYCLKALLHSATLDRKISEKKKQIIYLQWCIKYVSTSIFKTSISYHSCHNHLSSWLFLLANKLLQLFNVSAAFFWKKSGGASPGVPLGEVSLVWASPAVIVLLNAPQADGLLSAAPDLGGRKNGRIRRWPKSEWQESCVLCVTYINIYIYIYYTGVKETGSNSWVVPSIPLQRAFELRHLISPRSIYSGTTLGIPGIHEGPLLSGWNHWIFSHKNGWGSRCIYWKIAPTWVSNGDPYRNMQLNMCFISSYTPNLHHERLGNPVWT